MQNQLMDVEHLKDFWFRLIDFVNKLKKNIILLEITPLYMVDDIIMRIYHDSKARDSNINNVYIFMPFYPSFTSS